MKILALAAMPEELAGLEGCLEARENPAAVNTHFLQGNIAGHQVCAVQTGTGLVNAAMMTAISLERFSPNYAINIGVAGGLDTRLRTGDVIIGEEMVYNNVDIRALGYTYGQVPGGLPAKFKPDKKLQTLATALKADRKMQILPGLVVSSDEFIHTEQQISKIRAHWPQTCSVDMETTAIAHVCHRFSTPFLSLRVISDVVTVSSSKETFRNFMPVAANRATLLFTKLLGHL